MIRNSENRKKSIEALEELFTIASSSYIAKKLKIHRATVSSWKLRGVPFKDRGKCAIKLEEISKGRINRYRFCPEISILYDDEE
jgi:hypothetical protein